MDIVSLLCWSVLILVWVLIIHQVILINNGGISRVTNITIQGQNGNWDMKQEK